MAPPELKIPALDWALVKAVEGTNYPDSYKPRVAGRAKRRLGDALGLKNFGVNLTTIRPGEGRNTVLSFAGMSCAVGSLR